MVNSSMVEVNYFISTWLFLQTNTLSPVVENVDVM